jgi:hypothetical protein
MRIHTLRVFILNLPLDNDGRRSLLFSAPFQIVKSVPGTRSEQSVATTTCVLHASFPCTRYFPLAPFPSALVEVICK